MFKSLIKNPVPRVVLILLAGLGLSLSSGWLGFHFGFYSGFAKAESLRGPLAPSSDWLKGIHYGHRIEFTALVTCLSQNYGSPWTVKAVHSCRTRVNAMSYPQMNNYVARWAKTRSPVAFH